jgi:hypothetical protein
MDIETSTKAYEGWLAHQTTLLEQDLRKKHKSMASSPFPFLRATFYRWAQLWPTLCPELASAQKVLAVGDLHVENFGTWRDSEGRLVWGINDFDEAAVMPYTLDLVRLATSARLAAREDHHLSCDPDKLCNAVLSGYTQGLRRGGRPFVLAERNRWLRKVAVSKLRGPQHFLTKMEAVPSAKLPPPVEIRSALLAALPDGARARRFGHRDAGVGSLGRERFTLIADWHGGIVVREAKPLVTSAYIWANGGANGKISAEQLLTSSTRVPDPLAKMHKNWILRRLASDCGRIELSQLGKERDDVRLMEAMGWETANVHLATKGAAARIKRDLARRPRNWLTKAAARMAGATRVDQKRWAKLWKKMDRKKRPAGQAK